MRKLCTLAAVSPKVGKIHLSIVKKIVGLSSQIEAPPLFQKDLMNAATIGESSFKDFIQNQIESNNFGFYDPIKKNKLRSFDAAIITKIVEKIERQSPDYWWYI